MMPPKAVVCDIEGTTSAISFVKETLFPFAQGSLDGFLRDHAGEPEVAAVLDEVRALAPGLDPAEALRGWMERDEKVTPLKAVQGMIWRQGFESGALRGHLWPDVAPCLRAWARAGVKLRIYSSGSVEAQKLLFGHSEAGDLTPILSGFDDTRTGPKRAAGSYRAIAASAGLPAGEMLFLSDVAEELDAAADAGMKVCQLVRAADGTVASGRHPACASFPEVAARFGLPAPDEPPSG
ncbi:acireductone synthase [Roseomonas xinghualingensis]|uniref:acireductone synthase n=1 Tax=Roseomonas xinghualingensis TaxID=2986475 RepID=UPI0021F0C235|nr:acireductone synthase [Roseomonas sp. SXEYE001]MCV4206118.1 acireductone synthase [Roseomonas sp. SXEYE001]